MEKPVIDQQLLNASIGKIISNEHIIFLEERSPLIDEVCIIHHGITGDSRYVGKLVGVLHNATASAEPIPPPWDDKAQLSSEYMAKATHATVTGTLGSDPAERFKRAAVVDADARRIHESHVQRSSGPESFQSLLSRIGDPSEVIVFELECKGIVNITSLGNDIVGDSRIVLTQIRHESRTSRRIYFYQVRRIRKPV